MAIDENVKTEDNVSKKSNQYFTFILAGEEYGIDILNVLEIRGLERMTKIPCAPRFIKGIINLRGNIIPVMDLRERFNMATIDYTRSTVLIVLQIKDHRKDIGIIVDAVSDVYSINLEDIKPKPEVCSLDDDECISGLVTVSYKNENDELKNKLVILIDINKLLNQNDIQGLSTLSEQKVS